MKKCVSLSDIWNELQRAGKGGHSCTKMWNVICEGLDLVVSDASYI